MMNIPNVSCLLAGAVGIGMAGASYSTMTVSPEQHLRLQRTLSPELADVYARIVSERRDHYIQGLTLGSVLSLLVTDSLVSANSSTFHRVVVFIAITLIVCVTYYSIMPKSDYMLRHLNTKEQTDAWLDVYLTMKQRYMFGFILGVLSSIPLGLSMCKLR